MSTQFNIYPSALTIAGSDNTGGAGIQADLRTFSAFGVYGCSVITAVTSQTPEKIKHIIPVPAETVISQLETIFANVSIKALKTGMLFSQDIIDSVCGTISKYASGISIVIDPVMNASAGDRLFDSGDKREFTDALKQQLLPLACWITPNVSEAEIITGEKIKTFDDIIDAAVSVSKSYNVNCIVKGGHFHTDDDYVTDIVIKDEKIFTLVSPRVKITEEYRNLKGKSSKKNLRNVSHGTGCTFSAALTAALTLGMPWKECLKSAKAFVFGSLEEHVKLGKNMYAMYPPAENYLKYVRIKRLS